MRLNDKVYNVLKWIALVFLPAATTFVGILLPAVKVDAEITQTVITIMSAATAFLGALLGVSTAEYNKVKTEVENGNPDEE